jgi:Rrf2 family protein
MLALSQTTGYAALALSCLAYDQADWLLTRQIAACTYIPPAYLSKVLHSLTGAGLLEAKRGYHGGFRLARPASEITLAHVVAAVEGEDWSERCLLGLEGCSDDRSCPTHAFWGVERERIRGRLEQVTLQQIADFEHSLPQNKCGFLPCPPESSRDGGGPEDDT